MTTCLNHPACQVCIAKALAYCSGHDLAGASQHNCNQCLHYGKIKPSPVRAFSTWLHLYGALRDAT